MDTCVHASWHGMFLRYICIFTVEGLVYALIPSWSQDVISEYLGLEQGHALTHV